MTHAPSTPAFAAAAHGSTAAPPPAPRRRALAASARRRSCARRPAPKIRIGYWPIAAGLPFYAAVEKGYFKEAGLDVEPLQVRRRAAGDGSDAVGPLRRQLQRHRLGQHRDRRDRGSRALFKIFATNPSNAKNVLDEFLVPTASTVKTMADLKGKRVGSGPGIQNVTLAKTVLERGGATGATRGRTADRPARRGARRRPGRRLLHARADRHHRPPERHDARARGRRRSPSTSWATRWRRGTAARPSLTSAFIKKYPAEAKKFIAAYAKGIELRAQQAGRGAPVHEGLHRHRGRADRRGAAGRLHAVQRVQAERHRATSRSSSTCSPRRASSRRA